MASFETIKQRSQQVTNILRDVARVVGEKEAVPVAVTLTTGAEVVPGLNMELEARSLSAQALAIDEGLFTIIVAGTFKNGKSTLLNAMLGSKQLPAGAAPTTGIITMLVYGEDEAVHVYEYEKSEPRLLSLDDFFEAYRLKSEDADELKEFRFQNVRYARMACLHPICAKGVRLVDSPGLGEHTSRSELTTNFLKESQAVIMVLDANRLLSKDEREFILDQVGEGRLEHVFFVVNRVNQIDPEDLPELHQRARTILRPHFLAERGLFDEAHYNARVFWVNARDALRARQATPPNRALLEASGVQGFEQALEEFLTDEQMFRAGLDSSLKTMTDTVRKAYHYISGEKAVLGKPIDELMERRDRASVQLDELERRCTDIEEIIARTGESVQWQLHAHLHAFINQMERDWPKDSDDLIKKMEEIKFTDVAIAALRPAVREKIGKIVKNVIEQYLRQKFETWSASATELTQAEVEKLRGQLQGRIEEFVVKLNQARSEFTGDVSTMVNDQREIAITITTGIFAGGTGLWGIIGGTLRRLVLILLLLSVSTLTLFGWALLIVLILAEVGIVSKKETDFKRRMLVTIGKRVHDALRIDLQQDNFSIANFVNLQELLKGLREGKTALDRYIWNQLRGETRSAIEAFKIDEIANTKQGDVLAQQLVADLNGIVRGSLIYTNDRFTGINLPDETQRLLDTQPTGADLHLLNRYLLVDAYPDYLAPKLKDTINRTIKSQFVTVSQTITADLRSEIQQLRHQMDTTIADLQQETFSVEQEQQRLDDIRQQLLDLLNQANTIAGNRSATLEDFSLSALAHASGGQ